MPFDERLAQRIRQMLKGKREVTEKRMFGGLCFLFRGHMCCGIERDRLVVRVGPEQYASALARPHSRPMDFTGRPLKGFVYVSAQGCRTTASLKSWVSSGLDFAGSLPRKNAEGKSGK